MDALFEVERGHDGEIDGPSQVDQVGLGAIVDLELVCGIILVAIFAFIRIGSGLAVGVRATTIAFIILAENLSLDGPIALLVFDKLGILLEDVETLFDIELVVQTGLCV